MVTQALRLPDFSLAALRRHRNLPSARDCANLDALTVLIAPESASFLRQLPEGERWRALHARDKASLGKSRSSTLANARQTIAQLAYVKSGTGCFERLTQAGKLLRNGLAGI